MQQKRVTFASIGKDTAAGALHRMYYLNTVPMKKFVPIIMLGLTCLFASCSSKEPEPECKLKDFPYEIESVEKMTLIVASGEIPATPDMAIGRKKSCMQANIAI